MLRESSSACASISSGVSVFFSVIFRKVEDLVDRRLADLFQDERGSVLITGKNSRTQFGSCEGVF
jgi:hypothetical protein